MGDTDGQDMGYNRGSFEVRERSLDLCISALGRRAARMPGTGPSRRSSATAQIKALVCKSRFRAAVVRSPRRYFFPPKLPITRSCVRERLFSFYGLTEWDRRMQVQKRRPRAAPRRSEIFQ